MRSRRSVTQQKALAIEELTKANKLHVCLVHQSYVVGVTPKGETRRLELKLSTPDQTIRRDIQDFARRLDT